MTNRQCVAGLGVTLAFLAGCVADNPDYREDGSPAAADPGRVTLRRLNRTEYNNTVHDLLGTTLRPADSFPQDEFGYGFDNNADVLTVSSVHLEMYERAAEALVNEAMRAGGERAQRLQPAPAEFSTSVSVERRGDELVVLKNAETAALVQLPGTGSYRVTVSAYGEQAGDAAARMALQINGIRISSFDVDATIDAPGSYVTTVDLAGGPNRVALQFLNDFVDADTGLDRNLVITALQVEGPLGVQAEGPMRAEMLSCPTPAEPVGCAREILRRFARRAYRRPADGDELRRLLYLFQAALREGLTLEDGVRLCMKSILLWPNFLFRAELDPDPTALTPRPVSGHELASRLSYFLWSTMPDEELLALADSGALLRDDVLRQQARRMLEDPRAGALLDNFVTQWLQLRDLEGQRPDPRVFPSYTPQLEAAMQQETRLFLRSFLTEQAEAAEQLLTADYTFVNGVLGRHYGLAVSGEAFQRVALGDGPRAGLLGHASILTLTSFTTRTSPVRRGKWVLEQLLCSPPPPPPPGVEGLPDSPQVGATLREQLALHRQDPSCAGCHSSMDPIGLGLENFDAIGAHRGSEGGKPVDASGELYGQGFSGPRQLQALLAGDGRFRRCLVQKVFVYALGRGIQPFDQGRLDDMTAALKARGDRLRALIDLVIASDAFRTRRGEPAAAPGGQP